MEKEMKCNHKFIHAVNWHSIIIYCEKCAITKQEYDEKNMSSLQKWMYRRS